MSSGRVNLAFLSEELQAKILNNLPEEERKVLRQKLETIVNTGYSINEEELTKNVVALQVNALALISKGRKILINFLWA